MARLYTNENFPISIALELRRLGHDVLTIQDTGQAGKSLSDPDNLDVAIRDGRAILTYNRKDFIRLHRQRAGHEGIIVCTVDKDEAALAARIHAVLIAEADLRRKLIRVNRPAK